MGRSSLFAKDTEGRDGALGSGHLLRALAFPHAWQEAGWRRQGEARHTAKLGNALGHAASLGPAAVEQDYATRRRRISWTWSGVQERCPRAGQYRSVQRRIWDSVVEEASACQCGAHQPPGIRIALPFQSVPEDDDLDTAGDLGDFIAKAHLGRQVAVGAALAGRHAPMVLSGYAMAKLSDEVAQRRTFAIISHPDAGKTTLTEKLLLFGGAIQMAGAVAARGQARRATSDWMKIERERGISVTSSVMTFEYQDWTFNLLDTPGHADFSEDTYRTLTAVDSAIMVLDAAKGIENQTRKLFEVCRLRDMPIISFVNKLDREGRDPFELMDEVEKSLAIDVTPASWPIGMGHDFLGCYDIFNDSLVLIDKTDRAILTEGRKCQGLSDPLIDELLPAKAAAKLREEVEMVRELCPSFDRKAFLEGTLTPMFFGSALSNFGVRELLHGVADLAPSPRPQRSESREIDPNEEKVTGFVFKIQANMDPRHRDRIAFVRLCSGHFNRGMKLKIPRSGKTLAVNNAVLFQARDRELAQEAYAGDIVGIPNHGALHIGDALTQGEELTFKGIPSFAPEHLRKVRPTDPMRAKHLGKALTQLAEEGAAQAFKRRMGSEWIIGVVGVLQFEVMGERIKHEYDIEVVYETAPFVQARWVLCEDERLLKKFCEAHNAFIADDHSGAPVFLARSDWQLEHAADDFKGVTFTATKGAA